SGIQNVFGSNFGNTLTGNAQGNILVGGSASDTITGGSGRSLLIGGRGRDTVTGGADEDIVIWGRPHLYSNTAAPRAVPRPWQRTGTGNGYLDRIAALRAGVSVPGQPAAQLIWGPPATPGMTVHDDGSVNLLRGNPANAAGGSDWFFAGGLDRILDQESGEKV